MHASDWYMRRIDAGKWLIRSNDWCMRVIDTCKWYMLASESYMQGIDACEWLMHAREDCCMGGARGRNEGWDAFNPHIGEWWEKMIFTKQAKSIVEPLTLQTTPLALKHFQRILKKPFQIRTYSPLQDLHGALWSPCKPFIAPKRPL